MTATLAPAIHRSGDRSPAASVLVSRALAQNFSDERCRANLRAVAPLLRFRQDCEIFGEGERTDFIYRVASGVVRTCKFTSDGRRQIEAFHLPGDLFGLEMGEERSLSAEAVVDCAIIAYRRDGSGGYVLEDGSRLDLFHFAMRSLSRAQDHMLLLGRRSAMTKVAAFLLFWAERMENARTFSLPMTRQDIADYLGLTIETVSRTLSQLERDQIIELPGVREVRLKNATALHEMNM